MMQHLFEEWTRSVFLDGTVFSKFADVTLTLTLTLALALALALALIIIIIIIIMITLTTPVLALRTVLPGARI